jgi:citrate synthase
VVLQLLQTLARIGATPRLNWLLQHQHDIEKSMGMPLALSGVAAAAFADLGFAPREGEMLYLLLRLPGAAAHALEQGGHGYRRFPFFAVDLEHDLTDKEHA